MISGLAVEQKIRDYLDGNEGLDSFREWMVSAHIQIASAKGKAELERDIVEPVAKRLLADVESRYAEFSDGLLAENGWKIRLRTLLGPRPQSAESCFLTYFYSSSLQSAPAFAATYSGNFNAATNYQPLISDESELAEVA